MREEEEAHWRFDEEPGDEPGGADSASGGQGASSAGAGRELCQSYASFLEATNKEELFKGDELWVRRKRLRRR